MHCHWGAVVQQNPVHTWLDLVRFSDPQEARLDRTQTLFYFLPQESPSQEGLFTLG